MAQEVVTIPFGKEDQQNLKQLVEAELDIAEQMFDDDAASKYYHLQDVRRLFRHCKRGNQFAMADIHTLMFILEQEVDMIRESVEDAEMMDKLEDTPQYKGKLYNYTEEDRKGLKHQLETVGRLLTVVRKTMKADNI